MGKFIKFTFVSLYIYSLFGTSIEFDTWAGIGIVIFYLYNYVEWV
jgi:hypothetical protein